MRKKFDLEHYLEHPDTKVVTRNGNSARILCTDLRCEYHIVASITCANGGERVTIHDTNGCQFGYYCKSDEDLFFELPDPEKKRVPLTYEDLLQRVKEGKTMWIISNGESFQIVNFDEHKIIAYLNFYVKNVDLKDTTVMQTWRFADGDPCWKEVEE